MGWLRERDSQHSLPQVTGRPPLTPYNGNYKMVEWSAQGSLLTLHLYQISNWRLFQFKN
jgi:hypothetical protein